MENKKIGTGLWLRIKYIDECIDEFITKNVARIPVLSDAGSLYDVRLVDAQVI